jgi:branched-subunit amino acid aminotransferase/4-amino-4-deoxychorismate lyase
MTPPTRISCNGVFLQPSSAAVSVLNPAIYGAYGVYESLQLANGVVFAMEAHLARLAHSAQVIGLPLPAGPDVIGRWIDEVVAYEAVPDGTVRLFALGPDNGGVPSAYIWLQPPTVHPRAFYTAGATAVTFEARRYLPEAKSLNSLASYMAQRHARANGVHEALLHHDGRLTEGSNSNLFAVIGGELLTPPATEVLSGVTRDLVVMLAQRDGLAFREAPLLLSEIGRWSESFITSTSRHVMPVTQVDGEPIGAGAVGSFTRRLHASYEEYFAAHVVRQEPAGGPASR